MQVVEHLVTGPERCAYLPGRKACMEYRIIPDVAPRDLDRFLERGWRRFGVAYFRPACSACTECVSIRIPVDRFAPTRSQRRLAKRGRDLRTQVSAPRVDGERLALYDRWQRERSDRRGWDIVPMDAERYFVEFAFPHPSALEFALYDDAPERGRLVAVSLVDETPEALSAVYTYHDPEYRRYSPGSLSILRQIDYARVLGKRWVYLGYRVDGCASSEYKKRFRPHQLLVGWPDLDQPAPWRSDEETASSEGRER